MTDSLICGRALRQAINGAQTQASQIIDEANDKLASADERLQQAIDNSKIRDVKPPEFVIPQALIDTTAQPRPLFDSKDPFVPATKRLKNVKALDTLELGRRARLVRRERPKQ
jgi:hypothetical protein